ncbi:MAG: hypothetical protein O3A00_17615 [Planctomycetota bacterium]|nr:hypothetical protein [Planctomycetota bacterium]
MSLGPNYCCDSQCKIGWRWCIVLACVSLASGCCLPGKSKWNPFPCEPKCVLSPNPSKRELVQHINANAERLRSWRSTNATLSMSGMALPIAATIAVERPMKLRLIASSIRGDEADLGSNDESLWFWIKESEPQRIITVKHTDVPFVSDRMPIPFQPEWLIDALGVKLLREEDVELEWTDPENRLATLTGTVKSPDGKRIRRIIEVDTCMGHVRKHLLYNEDGRLIASARMSKHRSIQGTFVPKVIHLDWPEAQMQMKLTLGRIDVNPPDASAAAWQVPKISGYQVLDLGQFVPPGRRMAASRDKNANARVSQKRVGVAPTSEFDWAASPGNSIRQASGLKHVDGGSKPFPPTSPNAIRGLVSPGDARDEPPWADSEEPRESASAFRATDLHPSDSRSSAPNPIPPGVDSTATNELFKDEPNPFEGDGWTTRTRQ